MLKIKKSLENLLKHPMKSLIVAPIVAGITILYKVTDNLFRYRVGDKKYISSKKNSREYEDLYYQ